MKKNKKNISKKVGGPFDLINQYRIVPGGRKPLSYLAFGKIMKCSGVQVGKYDRNEQVPSYEKIMRLVHSLKSYNVSYQFLDKIFSELYDIKKK